MERPSSTNLPCRGEALSEPTVAQDTAKGRQGWGPWEWVLSLALLWMTLVPPLSWRLGGWPYLLVQLVAGTQHLLHRGVVVWRVQVKEVHSGALQLPQGRLQLGPETIRLQ